MTIITPTGVETVVNTTTTNSQISPEVLQIGGGRYVIVWVDNVPVGQESPTTLPGYVSTYANTDIRGQIFNADGTKFGSEFVVNTTTSAGQLIPQLTLLTDGNFLISWQDGVSTALGGTVPSLSRAQEFSATGAQVGSEFQISPAGTQAFAPTITAIAGGGFIAFSQQGWTSGGATGTIIGQIFDSNNAQVGSAFTVDATNIAYFSPIRSATLSDGNVVVVWGNGPGAAWGSSARIFTSTGTAVGNEFFVGSGPVGSSGVGGITALAAGGFAVSSGSSDPNQRYIHLEAFANDGTLLLSEQIASQQILPGFSVDVAPLANGGAVVSWTNGGDGGGSGISAVAYNAIGNVIGTPFVVNTQTAGDQRSTSIAVLSNGDFVITWQDFSATGGDTSGTAIRSQLYHVDPANQSPVAGNDSYFDDGSGTDIFDSESFIYDNDVDPDGDPLVVISVGNAQHGTVSLAPDGTITFNREANFTGNASFQYTVSDGNGGTSTATVTSQFNPIDNVTIRGGSTVLIDFLANDGLLPRPDGYQILINGQVPTAPIELAPSGERVSLIGTGLDTDALVFLTYAGPNNNYYNLAVGQTITTGFSYQVRNPVTGAVEGGSQVNITLQGWTQTGGQAADNLVGTALPDHLIGGNTAANTLTGGAGDDWYTVSASGDIIVELANEGFDSVWVRESVYDFTLAANLENLTFVDAFNFANQPYRGVGNASNNRIVTGIGNDTLIGNAGDDRLRGNSGSDLILGGAGFDISEYSAVSLTLTRLANGGYEVRDGSGAVDILRGIERVTFNNNTWNLLSGARQDVNNDGDSDLVLYSQSTGLISRYDTVSGVTSGPAVVGDTSSGNWDVRATGDFNADGNSDLVLKNQSTGQFYIWTLTNGVQTGGANLGVIGTDWDVRFSGDFNKDGNSDILWRDNSNGHLYVWTLNSASAQAGSASLGIIGTNWNAAGVGDFDGDGDSDVLLRNSDNGRLYLFAMENGVLAQGKDVNTFGTDWNVSGVGDFNGDGISDIALKNSITGQFYLLNMNSTLSYAGQNLGVIGTDWNIATTGDYNNDSTDDIVWRNSATNQVYLWAMVNGNQAATGSGNIGTFATDMIIV